MIDKAEGWAVVSHNGIDVKTVSETRRAAIVNWLVVNRRIVIINAHTDEHIERLWAAHADARDTICTTVHIELTPR